MRHRDPSTSSDRKERRRAYGFFFAFLLCSAALVGLLTAALGEHAARQRGAYNTSRGPVHLGEPLFDEVSAILFPGYDVRGLVAGERAALFETDEFAKPTIVLGDGSWLTVSLPVGLILHLLRTEPPDVLMLGSSRGREAFRPDVFLTAARQRGHALDKALNFCISTGVPEIYELFGRQLEGLARKPRLSLLMVDDFSVDAVARKRLRVAENLRLFERLCAVHPAAPGDDWTTSIPSIHHFLPDPRREAPREIPPPRPLADLAGEYQRFEALYVRRTGQKPWLLDSPALASLRRAVRLLEQHSQRVVVLTSPLTDAELAVSVANRSFEHMRRMSDEEGVPFLQLGKEDYGLENVDFHNGRGLPGFDPRHVNPPAAVHLTERLGELLSPYLEP